MARKKKGRRRVVRKTHSAKRSRKRPARRRRSARPHRARGARRSGKLVSRAMPVPATKSRIRKAARVPSRANPAREFVIEAYQPKGKKFFYYRGDDRLTTSRADAARYKSGPAAHKECLRVKQRAPAGIHWVRVCPA